MENFRYLLLFGLNDIIFALECTRGTVHICVASFLAFVAMSVMQIWIAVGNVILGSISFIRNNSAGR